MGGAFYFNGDMSTLNHNFTCGALTCTSGTLGGNTIATTNLIPSLTGYATLQTLLMGTQNFMLLIQLQVHLLTVCQILVTSRLVKVLAGMLVQLVCILKYSESAGMVALSDY